MEFRGSRLELFQHGEVHLKKNGGHSSRGGAISCGFSIPTARRRAPCIVKERFCRGEKVIGGFHESL